MKILIISAQESNALDTARLALNHYNCFSNSVYYKTQEEQQGQGLESLPKSSHLITKIKLDMNLIVTKTDSEGNEIPVQNYTGKRRALTERQKVKRKKANRAKNRRARKARSRQRM